MGSFTYTIQVEGHLDPRYVDWLGGMTLSAGFAGARPITVLSGALADQAALYGVLGKLHAMGVTLLALARLDPAHPDAADDEAR